MWGDELTRRDGRAFLLWNVIAGLGIVAASFLVSDPAMVWPMRVMGVLFAATGGPRTGLRGPVGVGVIVAVDVGFVVAAVWLFKTWLDAS